MKQIAVETMRVHIQERNDNIRHPVRTLRYCRRDRKPHLRFDYIGNFRNNGNRHLPEDMLGSCRSRHSTIGKYSISFFNYFIFYFFPNGAFVNFMIELFDIY